MKKEAL